MKSIHRHPATQELSSEIQWSLDHARRHNTFCFLGIDTSSVASKDLITLHHLAKLHNNLTT